MNAKAKHKSHGFTLMEMIVAIAIILILAVITASISGKFQKKASSVHSISNLRQISAAMAMYANDHGNRLPGPVWTGQAPYFFVASPDSNYVNGHLGHHLRDYLPTQYPSSSQAYSETFEYPQWKIQTRETNGPSYGIVRAIRVDRKWYKPLGEKTPGGKGDISSTMTMAELANLNIGDKIWIYELDAELVAGSPGWKQKLPKGPVHGKNRNALMFDFSVQSIPEKNFTVR